ncbi:MAG: hypothetical protein PVF45_12780, partial [Anaerolineae bacterium]
MNHWSQTDIHSEIKVLESELEAKRKTLSSLESVRSQLEEKAATYRNIPVPPNRIKLLQEKEKKIRDLKAEIADLEEARLVQTLIALGRRLDVEEELVFTVENLRKHVEQAERLQNKYEELKPSLALFLFHWAKLVEKSRGNGHAVRLLERSKELYRQINDESELAVVQNALINLLIRQGDDYYYSKTDDRDNTLRLAWRKYSHARDEIAHLRSSGQADQEIKILGRLVRLYEEQDQFAQALGCRLDRLGCLMRQEVRSKIYSEIRYINSLCHRLKDIEAAQNWIRTTYFRVKRLFVSLEDVGGLEILKDFATEFSFRKLESEIETVCNYPQKLDHML